jgi:hypothetical protein
MGKRSVLMKVKRFKGENLAYLREREWEEKGGLSFAAYQKSRKRI